MAAAPIEVIVVVPHASLAVALPKAAVISAAVGLQPKVLVVPVAVMIGGVRSEVQVTVLEAVAELPQPSTAVNVLICVTVQLAVVAVASEEVIVVVPHASVVLALAKTSFISLSF